MDNITAKLKITGNPEKFTPKFSNNINFTRLENNDVIINMSFVQPDGNDKDVIEGSIIESFVVTDEHAHKILEVLQQVLDYKK